MALHQWAVPQLSTLLSLDEDSSKQIVSYTEQLPDTEATEHLQNLLGDSPEAEQFITSFKTIRSIPGTTIAAPSQNITHKSNNPFTNGLAEKVQSNSNANGSDTKALPSDDVRTTTSAFLNDTKSSMQQHTVATPADNNPPGYDHAGSSSTTTKTQQAAAPSTTTKKGGDDASAPKFAPPRGPPPSSQMVAALRRPHTNEVIEAGKVRATTEQEMQNLLQSVQLQYGIYNSDIEPEHDTDYYCNCPICNYQRRKWNRYGVQKMWSNAVMYPGEKAYNDDTRTTMLFSSNPYRFGVISPYGNMQNSLWGQQRPQAGYYAASVRQTIKLNARLNEDAQRNINEREPKMIIWELDQSNEKEQQQTIEKSNGDKKQALPVEKEPVPLGEKQQSTSNGYPEEKVSKRRSIFGSSSNSNGNSTSTSTSKSSTAPTTVKTSKLTGLMKAMGVPSAEEKAAAKKGKMIKQSRILRDSILAEENGRWPDEEWRMLVHEYQVKIGMSKKVADLRARQPLQYSHLLRAGYFEPIPVAWANQNSNPLKFSIEAAAGWRGITPAWRGYEDTAEERLYWVLNHREGSVGMRMKPDPISEMNMARARMAMAVEPPPEYFSSNDVCHIQHTSEGYSRQVMPSPFRPFDRPETPNDDTMILLDVSGSMDFDPVRPIYDEYMITGYTRSTQPKNKDVAKAIIRRFTDAMANHDHTFSGYDLTTFASQATYIGSITHKNLDTMWNRVRIGGGTRVMTGWQKVKDRHFQKHSESAIHHPVYGWQAGPQTPVLRLLLLLDGEATDMDEFELDLLGLSWAHVTIFLIGVDGCPHHHRHANELQRISDVNHHVSFVDAQGNTPERYVTHELLKRHLGYDVTMAEFQAMEELPAYS